MPRDSVRAHLEAFLPHVGAPFPLPDPLPPDLQQGAEAFFAERRPDEAEIPLEPLPYPVLVVTGDHEPAFDAVADVLCARLRAERLVLPGRRSRRTERARLQRGARGVPPSRLTLIRRRCVPPRGGDAGARGLASVTISST